MEHALASLLLGYPTLAVLVGDRINWNLYPQGIASPAIRLSVVSSVASYHMQGQDSLGDARVQIDVRAESKPGDDAAGYRIAHEVAAAVKALLSGYRGTAAGRHFAGVFLVSERQTAEKAESTLYHLFSMDFQVWSRPA